MSTEHANTSSKHAYTRTHDQTHVKKGGKCIGTVWFCGELDGGNPRFGLLVAVDVAWKRLSISIVGKLHVQHRSREVKLESGNIFV